MHEALLLLTQCKLTPIRNSGSCKNEDIPCFVPMAGDLICTTWTFLCMYCAILCDLIVLQFQLSSIKIKKLYIAFQAQQKRIFLILFFRFSIFELLKVVLLRKYIFKFYFLDKINFFTRFSEETDYYDCIFDLFFFKIN